MLTPEQQQVQHETRRHFLKKCPLGLAGIYMAGQLSSGSAAMADDAISSANPMQPRKTHFPPRAKNVIYIHLAGSPPTLDLFDYKPELVKRNGQDCPDEFLKGRRFAFTSGKPKLMGTPRKFAQHGKSGIWMSDALPNLPKVADELCVVLG